MKSNAPPSMAEIARAACVAKSTVSLALRGDPRVAEPVKARVCKIATEMGYHTNALVARLMAELRTSRKQRYVATLAAINLSKVDHLQSKVSSVAEWMDGGRQRAESLGYTFDHFWLHESGISPQRLTRILHSRNILGVVFYGVWTDADLQRSQPIWSRFPSVVMGHHPRCPALNFVAYDHYATGLEVGTRLKDLGYKRIGIVLDKWLDTLLERRFIAGYRTSLGDEQAAPPILLLEDPQEYPRPEGKRRFFAWLEKHKIDACVCLNSFILDWLRESGRCVPHEVGLAFLDLQSEFQGKAAGVCHSAGRAGMKAVDAVVGQIHRRESGLPHFQTGLMLEGEWVFGPTVRDTAGTQIPQRQKPKIQKMSAKSR